MKSFSRGLKVAHINGTGGLLGKSAKMPMPTAPLKSGVGGFIPARRAPARGAAGCGDQETYDGVDSAGICGGAPAGVVQSLFTTIDDSTAAAGTAQITAQVTGGSSFTAAYFVLPDDIAGDWRVDSIMTPTGQNVLPNGQATRGDFFSSKNEFGGKITACQIPAALSLTVNLTNISGTTNSYAQGEFKGKYLR